MRKIKVKEMDLAIYCLYIALFKPYFLPETIRTIIKIAFVFLVLLYLLNNMKMKELKNQSLIFCFYVGFLGILNYIQKEANLKTTLDSFLYAICFFEVYTLVKYCCTRGKGHRLLKCLLNITFVYCLLTMISVALYGIENNSNETVYFFGNKFSSSYFFILFAALYYSIYYERIKKKVMWKLTYMCIIIISILFFAHVVCATALVSSFVFVLFLSLPEKVKGFLTSPKIATIILILSAVIIPFLAEILNLPVVENFIVNVLHKSANLTNRLNLYNIYLFPVIKERLWFGYGYNNDAIQNASGVIWNSKLTYYANAQNGLLDYVVKFGLIGTAIFVFLFYSCFRKSILSKKVMGIQTVIYTMLLASVVEVTINWIFILGISLICWLDQDYEYEKST